MSAPVTVQQGAKHAWTQIDDSLLVLRTREGSREAFEAIVARYWSPLMRFVTPIVGGTRAEDVVQVALIKAHAAIQAGGCDDHLSRWLYRVAHNAAVDVLRDRSWRNIELDRQRVAHGSTEELAMDAQHVQEVVKAVKALPSRQRQAIVGRELEGRTYHEIAVRLGTSSPAVRQLLVRARATLRSSAAA